MPVGAPSDPFAAWLRRELDDRGFGQVQFAERLGQSPVTVAQWLDGSRRPMPHMRDRVAAALGIDPAAVPTDPPKPEPPTAAWLRTALAARGLTHEEFAARIGVAQGTVTRWVAGEHGFRPARLPAIVRALDLTADEERNLRSLLAEPR